MYRKISDLIKEGYFSDSELQFLNDVEKLEKISNKKQLELVKLAQSGDSDAKKRLIETNVRNVVKVATKYVDSGVPFLDLVQEGSVGLAEAINMFDDSKGSNFVGYAFFHISNALESAMENNNLIRIPSSRIKAIKNMNMIVDQLRVELNREPAIEDIAKKMGTSYNKVASLLVLSQEVDSLERQIDGEEDELLMDCISSDVDLVDEVNKDLIHDEIMNMFNDLSDDEDSRIKFGVEVLKNRFGFDGRIKTLEELSKEYDCDVQTLKSREGRAFTKLLKSSNCAKIIKIASK